MRFSFYDKDKKRKKRKRLSLKWKWTVGATLAIFLTFSIFSFAIFVGFRQIMFTQEEENFREVLFGATSRLVDENKITDSDSTSLSKATVYSAFNPSYFPDIMELNGEYDQRNTTFEDSGNYEDTLYAKMNEEDVIVRVYTPTPRLLFESKLGDFSFEESSEPVIKMIDVNGEEGYYGVAPVISDETQQIIGYVQVIDGMSDYHNMIEVTLISLIAMSSAALIFSGILGYFLASNFLKPIKNITKTMNDLRQDTQSTSRIEVVEGNDELDHLSIVFNDMLDKMQKYIEQQKQFVEDVSHELRTPVAVMEGHLKLLDRWGKNDPEILDESLSASLQEITRMKSLVQEMLDLSRAEQVEIHYKNEKTSIKPIIQQTYNNFQMIHPDFVFNLDDDINEEVYVSIYRNHIEQILIILLDNAVKYSTERKEVHISVANDDREVQIAIQDFGEGMTPEDAEKIFNRFYRIDKARSRHKGGNGLGLAIAKELLSGYNGTITVESVLDYGSIFRITLPDRKSVV